MTDTIRLPDGTTVGTGLLIPPTLTTAFAPLESAVDLLTDDEIRGIASSGVMDGRRKFDSSWVKSQGSFGSCNGHAGASALSRARVRRGLPRVDLSGAYLYSLINWGRDNGSLLDDGMRELQSGVATEATVPWDAIYPSKYDRQKAAAEAIRFRAWECYATRNERAVFTAAALGFDIVVAVHAGNAFMRPDRDGIVGVDRGPGNHAVLVDGVAVDSSGVPFLTGCNSWGVSYGVQGRMGLTWSHLSQPSQFHQFYALRSTTDDPNDTNPPGVL